MAAVSNKAGRDSTPNVAFPGPLMVNLDRDDEPWEREKQRRWDAMIRSAVVAPYDPIRFLITSVT